MLLWLLLALFNCAYVECLRVRGEWNSQAEVMHVIAKFGFQKTDALNKEATRGFIYGNITAIHSNVTDLKGHVVLLEETYFQKVYANRNLPADMACFNMLDPLKGNAYESRCFPEGKDDRYRKVPCKSGELCSEEIPSPNDVIAGSQFTFRVQDTVDARYSYLALFACSLNQSCLWRFGNVDIMLRYDIWLVNGNPNVRHLNPFEHQFSFDKQDVVEIYFTSILLFGSLAAIQAWSMRRVSNRKSLCLLVIICAECVGCFFNAVHFVVFAVNGVGSVTAQVIGEFCTLAAQRLLVLLLVCVGHGWCIYRTTIHKRRIFLCWGIYCFLFGTLYIWNALITDEIDNVYYTWPGWLIMLLRVLALCWFVLELRWSVARCQQDEKCAFLVHFGAGFLVWFFCLPFLGVVSPHITLLWRYKAILAISLLADCLAMLVLVHLFWPTSANRRFFLHSDSEQEELDEFERTLIMESFGDESQDEMDAETDIKYPFIHSHSRSNGAATNGRVIM